MAAFVVADGRWELSPGERMVDEGNLCLISTIDVIWDCGRG